MFLRADKLLTLSIFFYLQVAKVRLKTATSRSSV